jgi:hypothetical protein
MCIQGSLNQSWHGVGFPRRDSGLKLKIVFFALLFSTAKAAIEGL